MDLDQQLSDHILSQYFKGQAPENFDDDLNLIDECVLDFLAILGLVD